ncbi:hypothetical protein [Gilvimarinus chinensis]|uniref:hypothetical protein n=1 Tax=Gilvimarinus chinensis TaxID=396005 RepID=UPI00036EF7AD|nr:hypothetical protein [Gilvimarinus chinensis]
MSEERMLEGETANYEALRDNAINLIRSQVPTGKGPAHCIECGDDMPKERRDHGFVLCVDCKTLEERP